MDANVSPVPDHQVGRITPIRTRARVALVGLFEFQIDLTKLTEEELVIAKEMAVLAKQTRRLRATGALHHLRDPFKDNGGAWCFVAEDQSEMLATYVYLMGEAFRLPMRLSNNVPMCPSYLALRGLDPEATYRSVHGPGVRGVAIC